MQGARFRRIILNRPNLRIPFPEHFVERLRGTTVNAISRRGKYLMVALSSGETLIMHLGMSGWFHVAATGDRTREADAHDHVIFVMSSGHTVVFNDPRRFGFMDLVPAADLGRLPVAPRDGRRSRCCRSSMPRCWRQSAAARRCRSRSRCWTSAWSPASATSTRARRCTTRRCRRCARRRASPRQRGSRRRSASGSQGDQGRLTSAIRRSESPYRAGRFRVMPYESAEPCLRPGCDGVIRQITQAARSTFYCATCQR